MKKLFFTLICLCSVYMASAQTPCNLSFTVSPNSPTGTLTVTVTNTSSFVLVPGSTPNAWVEWGDNQISMIGYSNGSTAAHTYPNTGLYVVSLHSIYTDSANNNVQICSTSVMDSIIVTNPPPPPTNVIQGHIYWDTAATNAAQSGFRVWLIQHDATANTLTAIDSQDVMGYTPLYSFSGQPAGQYLTKAAAMPGTPAGTYLLPTYHDSSLYWSTAQSINHNAQGSTGNIIYMRNGTPTSGPGFIGGNISAGANKGTGGGIPGIMVALLSSSGQTINYTYTNANGDYSFSGLPIGSYTVFPEALNYITVQATNVAVTATAPSVTSLHFKQTPTHIKLIPAGINDLPSADLFTLYPNPANNGVTVRFADGQFGKVTISLTDVIGRQLMVKEKELEATSIGHLNLSDVPSGIYFLRMATDKATHSEKIIVKH